MVDVTAFVCFDICYWGLCLFGKILFHRVKDKKTEKVYQAKKVVRLDKNSAGFSNWGRWFVLVTMEYSIAGLWLIYSCIISSICGLFSPPRIQMLLSIFLRAWVMLHFV